MKTVQPIRDKGLIEKIKKYLKNKNLRDYMIFILGINTGLRISDLLSLKVYQVRDKNHLVLDEKKTKKEKRILLTRLVQEELKEYFKYLEDQKYKENKNKDIFNPSINNDYLFKAKYTDNQLSRVRVYQIIKDIEREFNLNNLGTHTLRKSFGYHFYKQFNDIATLMDIYNHSKEVVTLRYICLNQDTIDKRMNDFELGGL